jgi:MFS family permease
MLGRRWREIAGGLPPVYWYLWSTTLIGNIASFVLIFITFYLLSNRGFSAIAVGVVLALTGAGSVLGSTTGGMLADRWSRRGTAVAGYLLSAVALVGTGLSTDLPAIGAFMLVIGVGMSFSGTATSAMIADVVPAVDRPRAYSIDYWAINVGTSIAALLAPLVMDVSFGLIFVVDAAGVLLLAAIVVVLVPDTRPPIPAAEPETAPRAGVLRTVLTDRTFLMFVVLFFGFQLIFKQNNAGLPLAVQHDGLDAGDYGRIYVVNTLLIVIGQLFLPLFTRNRQYSRVLAAGALLVGLGFGLTGFADAVWFYAITVAIWTMGEMAYFAVLDSTLAGMAPERLRGSYFGVFASASQLSRLAAPLIAGYLLQHYGEALWIGCLAVGLATAAGYLLTARARERRIAVNTADRTAEPVAG